MNTKITNIDIWKAVISMSPSIELVEGNIWRVQYPAGGSPHGSVGEGYTIMDALIAWYNEFFQIYRSYE